VSRAVLLSLALLPLAFAPAPLPRRQARANDSLAVARLVGVWRATGLYHTPNKARLDPDRGGVGHVIITPTRWTFSKTTPVVYDLRIHDDRRPVQFDLMHQGSKQPYGMGLMRREGNLIRVIYGWNGTRPKDFEESGYVVLTLVRE
jgi:hypothetical protein